MKKRYLVLILLSLIALALPMAADAETKSGTCGDSLTWTLDDAGLLTISGTGEMANYESQYTLIDDHHYAYTTAPWGEYTVKQVEIQKGVTSIGDFAFNHYSSLTSVTIPDSVTSRTSTS